MRARAWVPWAVGGGIALAVLWFLWPALVGTWLAGTGWAAVLLVVVVLMYSTAFGLIIDAMYLIREMR